MTTATTNGLEFESVHLQRGDFVLKVSTGIPKGLLTVILGPSGCGKTTLLDLAAGFLAPQSGRVFEHSADVTGLPPQKRRMGVVFQDPALFPHLSVLKNVAFGPICRGTPRMTAYRTGRKLLGMVNLAGYEKRKPRTLSGGERQRVALARALAIEPDVLLLDEPFSALDANLRRTLREEVRTLQQKLGITMLLVSHDQDEAMSMADHIVLMNQGQIADEGQPRDLWKHPASLFTARFLGHSTRLAITGTSGQAPNQTLVTSAGKLQSPCITTNKQTGHTGSTLVARPQYTCPEPGGPLQAHVSKVEYCGGYYRVRAVPPNPQPDDQIVYECTHPPPNTGEPMQFTLDPGGISILEG